jgi:phosphatidate phosphatase LPIN
LFLWDFNRKIIISDVDGTITRSDMLGHVLPRLGRDWAHKGIAKLYTAIKAQGYEFLYLTSRPIGQADTTREYIKSIIQDDVFIMPDGPVIMSPDRLLRSFKREVI